MEICNGKLYKNRTYTYLYPILKYYGDNFKSRINKIIKLGVGIKDTNYDCRGDRCIFILLQSKNNLNPNYDKNLQEFLDWIKTQDYYKSDYIFSNINKNRHMIVLKIPTIFNKSFDNFILGKYSKMFSKNIIETYFKDTPLSNNKRIRSVLNKDSKYLQSFVDIINKEFNTSISKDRLTHIELDYPLNYKKETEIFNE
jgi:hypothetical protein